MRPARVKIAKAPEKQKSGGSEAGKLSNGEDKTEDTDNNENKEENK
jgi:hypothetical protein